MSTLRRRFLELLDKDKEFRYIVAGYLGLSEVLKRLDSLADELARLREDFNKLSERSLKLEEGQNKLWARMVKLEEGQNKLWAELARLREDFNNMFKVVNARFEVIETRLGRVERTLEKLTVDIEEEARSIIKHRLREDLGVEMELGTLTLPDVELNIYGASGDLCVIGEATVRGGIKLLHELESKMKLIERKYPDRLRRTVIPVIYASLPLPELIDGAKEMDVWLLKAQKDYHRPKLLMG